MRSATLNSSFEIIWGSVFWERSKNTFWKDGTRHEVLYVLLGKVFLITSDGFYKFPEPHPNREMSLVTQGGQRWENILNLLVELSSPWGGTSPGQDLPTFMGPGHQSGIHQGRPPDLLCFSLVERRNRLSETPQSPQFVSFYSEPRLQGASPLSMWRKEY